MTDYILFWLAKHLIELAIPALIIVAWILFVEIPNFFRHLRCDHGDVFENGRCDAICRKCGANLGFIGAWREKQKERQQ